MRPSILFRSAVICVIGILSKHGVISLQLIFGGLRMALLKAGKKGGVVVSFGRDPAVS